MGVLSACMSVHHTHPALPDASIGHQIPCDWSYKWLWAVMGSGPGPLEEQPTLLTSEPSAQPHLQKSNLHDMQQ